MLDDMLSGITAGTVFDDILDAMTGGTFEDMLCVMIARGIFDDRLDDMPSRISDSTMERISTLSSRQMGIALKSK